MVVHLGPSLGLSGLVRNLSGLAVALLELPAHPLRTFSEGIGDAIEFKG